MKRERSVTRLSMRRLLSLSLLPGLTVLTACGSAPKPPPMPTALTLTVPASISAACERTERPSLPPPGTLDTPKPAPLPNGQYSADDMNRVWLAFGTRGRWTMVLSQFSIEQEGDLSRCDARRAAAVEIIEGANALAQGDR